MHFSHSYKWLGKCTFLKLCTMHFCTARTIVHWTVTARMEPRTFLKMTALTTLKEDVRKLAVCQRSPPELVAPHSHLWKYKKDLHKLLANP